MKRAPKTTDPDLERYAKILFYWAAELGREGRENPSYRELFWAPAGLLSAMARTRTGEEHELRKALFMEILRDHKIKLKDLSADYRTLRK
ncbi:MAG: hypothetical protein ABSF12_09190, partial [Bryobacteraceae bacterium]